MRRPGRKCFGAFIAVALFYLSLSGLYVHLSRNKKQSEIENSLWVATSKHWLDRQLCKWLELCGTFHLANTKAWQFEINPGENATHALPEKEDYWTSGPEDPESWSEEEKALREIPQYVLDHAPYVHLFSGEQFWPGDLAEHLSHTTAHLNYTEILDLDYGLNMSTVHKLNDYESGVHGRFMYLRSNDNVEEWPKWMEGFDNIPHAPEVFPGDEEEVPWPGFAGLEEFDVETAKEQALLEQEQEDALPSSPESSEQFPPRIPSTNGRCAGHSGFTCKGSRFGSCCSIYGWCGKGDAFCGSPCDPLAGECNDPFEPRPRPHTELRRRDSDSHQKSAAPPVGRSKAPAFLVVVPKENGIVDAFWFFFYSFNLGQKVFNIRFGNHVGDWEHTLIRFQHGKPQSVFLSEHDFGAAYSWHALEKYTPDPSNTGTMLGTWSNHTASRAATRPVVYSATGSHAMYAVPGLHPYVLPWGLLHDQTDRGPLWDPLLNLQAFTYNLSTRAVRASTRTPHAPTNWFNYAGHWGDKYYALSDPRQYRLARQYHYVNGPSGPRFKFLGRKEVCEERGGKCHVKHWADGGGRPKRLPLEEGEEEGGLPGGNFTDEAPKSMMKRRWSL